MAYVTQAGQTLLIHDDDQLCKEPTFSEQASSKHAQRLETWFIMASKEPLQEGFTSGTG